MSQPPYRPPRDDGAGDEESGSSRWRPPADEPTEVLGRPGQRDPTRPLPPPGHWGQPAQWGQPTRPPRGNRTTVIALVVAAVVVVAAAGVALYLVLGNRDDATTSADRDRTTKSGTIGSSSTDATTPRDETTTAAEPSDDDGLPDPTVPPEGLGNDPLLDALADACYVGDMQACDDLFDLADAGSDYQTYGDTCAGRQLPGTLIYCTETFPEN